MRVTAGLGSVALIALHALATPAHAFTAARSASGRAARSPGRSAASGVRMMPVGVPKVAYRAPGSTQGDWVDIYNRLYRERIMFLGQQIDTEIANQILGIMLFLDSEDNTKPMYMYINSPGGSVTAGMAMFDTINHVKSDVITINVGLAASMASFLLAAGARGKRMALPHSRVMIHQPMGATQGQAEDIKVEAIQVMNVRDRVATQFARLTGQPKEKVRSRRARGCAEHLLILFVHLFGRPALRDCARRFCETWIGITSSRHTRRSTTG